MTSMKTLRSRGAGDPLTPGWEQDGIVQRLAEMATNDDATTRQQARLSDLAFLLGRRLGLDGTAAAALRTSTMLRDVGAIGMDRRLLHKAGPLTDSEQTLLHLHPLLGEQIVRPLHLDALIGPAIRGHHERWDGAGYPDGLAGAAIPFLARIASVLGAFDTMTSHQPYGSARTVAEARLIIRAGAGAQWDPEVVGAFDALLAQYPYELPHFCPDRDEAPVALLEKVQ
jgi:HD-GYP domain-containing protein (c-di-GMP phosphodiesterase class II)